MKKNILAIIMIMALCLTFCACGGNEVENEAQKEADMIAYLEDYLCNDPPFDDLVDSITSKYGYGLMELIDYKVNRIVEDTRDWSLNSERSNYTDEQKKILDEALIKYYNVSGSYVITRDGNPITGEWNGLYMVGEYEGEFGAARLSYSIDVD